MRRRRSVARLTVCAVTLIGFAASHASSAHAAGSAAPAPAVASVSAQSYPVPLRRPQSHPLTTPSPLSTQTPAASSLGDRVLSPGAGSVAEHGVSTPASVAVSPAGGSQVPPTALRPAAVAFDTVPTLSISVPAGAALGTGLAGSTAPLSSALGPVTVTTTAGTTGATFNWAATVTSTAFTTGGASPAEMVAASRVTYYSGLLTARTGNFSGATCTPGQTTSLSAVTLSASRMAFTCNTVSATGATSLTWNPTIVVTPTATNVPGAYTATITHSVA
jgi:hypothetical protein